MKKKIVLAIVALLFLIAGVSAYFVPKLLSKPEAVHYHAGFQVYVGEELQNFSNFRYMHIMPCTTDENDPHPKDEQLEKAHLHDLIGDVVHVHRENATWQDLFINMKYSIDDNKITSAYVNGEQVEDILTRTVNPYESVVIFIGKAENEEELLNNQVTKKHIQDTEKEAKTVEVKVCTHKTSLILQHSIAKYIKYYFI